jgi:hypothetical protein
MDVGSFDDPMWSSETIDRLGLDAHELLGFRSPAEALNESVALTG